MKISVLFLIVLMALNSSANDRTYNRLFNLYKTDIDKCLAVSKKQISNHPEKSAPYYFASRIYLDKFNDALKITKKYSLMSRSISYGTKLDKFRDKQLEDKVNWKSFKTDIINKSVVLISELNKVKLTDKADKLSRKLKRLGYSPPKKKIVPKKSIPKKEVLTEFIDGEYYGLPLGNEVIKSANLSGEKEVLALINAERKKQGMGELVWEEDLAKAARYHAYDLATQKYFAHNSHDRKNGQLIEVGNTFIRIRKFYSKSFVNSENIAGGSSTAGGTYSQWFNSPGHYDNMFNKSSEKVGIGVFYDKNSPFGYYWVFCTAL